MICLVENPQFYFQPILNYFHCFCTSTIKIVPVQTILYQFKLFCPSSKTNCSKVKIELQQIHAREKFNNDKDNCNQSTQG